MKKSQIKILISVALLLVLVFAGKTLAAGDYLYTSPATGSVNTGASINTSIMASTSGDKICAIQGSVVFNNATCQSIVLASRIMAQTSPTCSNPNFVLGIPGCATSNTKLFTISSVAGNPGSASISFTNVNLVGTGVSVGNASLAANYTINALPKPTTQKQNIATAPKTTITKQLAQAKKPKAATSTTSTVSKNTNVGALALIGDTLTNPTILWVVIVMLLIFDVAYFTSGRAKRGK